MRIMGVRFSQSEKKVTHMVKWKNRINSGMLNILLASQMDRWVGRQLGMKVQVYKRLCVCVDGYVSFSLALSNKKTQKQ